MDDSESREKIKQIGIAEFVRRLKREIDECEDSRFVFFIGAGCSISSGIPGASELVKTWLRSLKRLRTGDDSDSDNWANIEFKDYDANNPAKHYGKVIEELFFNSETRQKEIERLTDGKYPGFGYTVLAKLMGHEDYGGHCNAVLTVNFDDLIADALYLYTDKKPLVIVHESLVGFVRSTRKRPLILKLHGDARLEPKNTESETNDLSDSVKKVLKNFLAETGLIFIGYGGHDESIAHILKELPSSALPWGVYWINDEIPQTSIEKWLYDRKAIWVNHKDFDELMLLIWKEFDLSHPDEKRFDRLIETYMETFDTLRNKLELKPENEVSKELAKSLDKALKDAEPNWWGYYLEAEKCKKTDPNHSENIYIEAMSKFPNNDNLPHGFALFLRYIRKENDRAEEYYKKSLELNPKSAPHLGNYAIFLEEIRKDYDRAEEYYKKSLELNPKSATHLANYANFLANIRKDYDKAEEYYKKSFEIRPDHAKTLGDYANFLADIRKDYDKAEEYYKKSLELNPNDAIHLGNYANFLADNRKDYDRAEEYYKKSLELNPNNADQLGNYAVFLKDIRIDYDRAEEYYKKSLELNPNDADNLGNYAGFLLARGDNSGFDLLQKALELNRDGFNKSLSLELLFYEFAHTHDNDSRKASLSQIKILLREGARSPGWNFADNIKRAIEDTHPCSEFLSQLSKVISDEKDIKSLDRFDAWTKEEGC
ncbi:MAG: tetratricopeptide repeat protein [Methanothrix sp.]